MAARVPVSFGVVVRKGLVVPERELHHFSWVLSKQKNQSWTQTREVVDCIAEYLALPTIVGSGSIAAGEHHTCVVQRDGGLVCFGANDRGQCIPPMELGRRWRQ